MQQRFTLWVDHNILAACAIFLFFSCNHFPRARGEESPTAARVRPFLAAKTLFQTNRPYDPRLAIAVDAVIVHRHGAADAEVRRTIGSWKRRGYSVGRMLFADSDAGNLYWKGKWDGKEHPDEVVLLLGLRALRLLCRHDSRQRPETLASGRPGGGRPRPPMERI